MSSDEHFSLRLSDSDSENQAHQKNDDAKRTQGTPQKQLSTDYEIFESEEPDDVRLERSVKNLPTLTNDYLPDDVCKLNSSSNSSAELSEYAISDSMRTSDSSVEFLGFDNSFHSFFQKVTGNKRQVFKKTITTSSGKNLSNNRKFVSSNFESNEKEEKNLPFSTSTNSSTEFLGFQNTYSERNLHTNNNDVSSDFESVKKKNKKISEINNSSQRRYSLHSNRFEESDSSLYSSSYFEKSSNQELGFEKQFHTDEISYSKKNHDKNIPSSSSSDSLTEFLRYEITCLPRNLPTNQNNVPSDFEPIRKKRKNIPLKYSSDSSIEFSGFVTKITSTPKNRILKRRRYCKPSSNDESDDSSPNDRNKFIVRIDQKNKHRKLIGTSSSSDSEDILFIPQNPSKSSSRSKNKWSSTDENYSSSVNTAKSDIKVSRRRKEGKIKKLRKYFINGNVDLHRQKYFWRDCQLNVDKVLKWIKNQKNINHLIEDPRELQREIEVYLEYLELNTRSIISLNKRVSRSQTAAQRWQDFLQYGRSVKAWDF